MTMLSSQCCIKKPLRLPVALGEMKEFLKITYDADDQLLLTMIAAATQRFENYTSRALIHQTWAIAYRQISTMTMPLPIKPAVAINEIQRIDLNGSMKEYPLRNITLEIPTSEVKFHEFPYAYIVKIIYTAGYGNCAEHIPSDIKAVLMTHIAQMYEQRSVTPTFALSVYEPFKVMRL